MAVTLYQFTTAVLRVSVELRTTDTVKRFQSLKTNWNLSAFTWVLPKWKCSRINSSAESILQREEKKNNSMMSCPSATLSSALSALPMVWVKLIEESYPLLPYLYLVCFCCYSNLGIWVHMLPNVDWGSKIVSDCFASLQQPLLAGLPVVAGQLLGVKWLGIQIEGRLLTFISAELLWGVASVRECNWTLLKREKNRHNITEHSEMDI